MERDFQRLLQAWRSLGVAENEPMAIKCGAVESGGAWDRAYELMLEEQRGLMESGAWFRGRSDLLGVIGRARREVDHCAVLAWLLDPRMPHGLGVRFLRRFLKCCFPDES